MFFGLIGLILLYLLLLPLGAIVPVNRKYQAVPNGVDIFLTTNGMHVDFVVPTQHSLFDWSQFTDSTPYEKALSNYPYLGIGWGDWGFYVELDAWENLSAKLALKTLLNPTTPTLMHLTGYDQLPSDTLKVQKISLSKSQYLRLCSFILAYFVMDDQQQPVLLPELGYTPNDNFYQAKGNYHALHTCNYWINKGLKKTGVRTALWSPLDKGIFYQLQKLKPLPAGTTIPELAPQI
ncbi:MAG: TIGR02117 family protein [Bacteroidota bacterium]